MHLPVAPPLGSGASIAHRVTSLRSMLSFLARRGASGWVLAEAYIARASALRPHMDGSGSMATGFDDVGAEIQAFHTRMYLC